MAKPPKELIDLLKPYDRGIQELTLAPDAITFESREHPFRFAISDVRLDGDGITDSSGKNWHFSIKDIDPKLVFEQWKNGALFR